MAKLRADRLQEAMDANGVDQSQLARLVGCTPGAINQILQGNVQRSRFLPEIVKVLGIRYEWLMGHDVPRDADSDQRIALKANEQELIGGYRNLPVRGQTALVQLLAAMPRVDEEIRPEDHLPDERVLARMFEALLMGMDLSKPLAEQARLLAQRLPIGLSQLRDLIPASEMPATSKPRQRRATRVPEPQS